MFQRPNQQAPFVNAYDAGLRAYLFDVYRYMTLGLVLSGIVAFASVRLPIARNLFFDVDPNSVLGATPLTFAAYIATVAIAIAMALTYERLSRSQAGTFFWVFSVLIGIVFGHMFFEYGSLEIAPAFFSAAALFGSMSLLGYLRANPISNSRHAMRIYGGIGIVLAFFLSLALNGGAEERVVSILAIILYAGVTAWATGLLKEAYEASPSDPNLHNTAVMGALTLHIAFVVLVTQFLRFRGGGR